MGWYSANDQGGIGEMRIGAVFSERDHSADYHTPNHTASSLMTPHETHLRMRPTFKPKPYCWLIITPSLRGCISAPRRRVFGLQPVLQPTARAAGQVSAKTLVYGLTGKAGSFTGIQVSEAHPSRLCMMRRLFRGPRLCITYTLGA